MVRLDLCNKTDAVQEKVVCHTPQLRLRVQLETSPTIVGPSSAPNWSPLDAVLTRKSSGGGVNPWIADCGQKHHHQRVRTSFKTTAIYRAATPFVLHAPWRPRSHRTRPLARRLPRARREIEHLPAASTVVDRKPSRTAHRAGKSQACLRLIVKVQCLPDLAHFQAAIRNTQHETKTTMPKGDNPPALLLRHSLPGEL